MNPYREKLLASVEQCIEAVNHLKKGNSVTFIESVAERLSACFTQGHKVLIAGNGGSLCDASHFAEELTGVFRKLRRALPAIVLADAAHITCTGNDLGFQEVFARGVEAYGKPGDLFIGLTTSGRSPNIIRAFEVAKQLNLETIAFLGKDGGLLKGVADFELIIDGFSTSDRIQEVHMAAIHLILEVMEAQLFPVSALSTNAYLFSP